MKIKNGKDFWAGMMFIGAGIFFMIASRAFPMGTAVRMGPAYFPTVLGGIMVALGLVIFVRAFVSKVPHSIDVFAFRWILVVAGGALAAISWMSAEWFDSMGKMGSFVRYYGLSAIALFLLIGSIGPRPLFVILLATVAFGYLLKPLGLVLATLILIFVSAWGGHEFKLREVTYLYVAMAIFGVAVFVYGLGLPINIWPELG